MSLEADIGKRLGDFKLQVHLQAGETVLGLLGASGSGKTMTLKCIAGIERPDSGRIAVNGRVLFDGSGKINVAPQKRRTGLMSQNYALFPNMTVLKNIEAGAGKEGKASGARARELLERFGLNEVAAHYPAQLSGGQQQRTALARILISDPDILMLDEPFSALDAHLRFTLEQELRQILKDYHKTVILVSHDKDEVYRLCDHVAVMKAGRVEAFGDKKTVYADPGTISAARITGYENISGIRRLDAGHVQAADWGIVLQTAWDSGEASAIGIRAEQIRLIREPDKGSAAENHYPMQVQGVIENPLTLTLQLKPAGHETDLTTPLCVRVPKDQWSGMDHETVWIHIPPESAAIMT